MKHAAIVIIAIVLFLPPLSIQTVDAKRNHELITAHRGSSGTAPENTVASVRQAIADGAGFAEIDVQLSAEGPVGLYHDETLAKFGIAAKVSDLDYDMLASLAIGYRAGRQYSGERIPRLEQVIAESRDRIKLNIELKMYEPRSALPETVASILVKERFVDQCVVTSFDRAAIERVMAVLPHIKTGLIVRDADEIDNAALQSGIALLSVKSTAVDKALVKRLRDADKELHVWTVNSKSEMKRMLEYDVHSVITDYPQLLYRLIHK